VAVATRLANLRPQNPRWQNVAAHAILAQRPEDRAAARPYVLRAQRVGFDASANNAAVVSWARAFDVYDAWLRNDAPEALRLAEALVRDLPTPSQADASPIAWLLSCIYLTLGRLDAASEIALMSPPTMRRHLTVRVALEREDPRAIRELVAREYPSNEFFIITTALIASRQLDEARQGITFMRRNPAAYARWLDLSEGSLALMEGRTRAALGHLERLPRPRDPRESVALAEALADSGRVSDAIAVLEDVSSRRSEMVIQGANLAWHWLHAREALAQLYRRAGRDADADAVEAELRKLLEVADDDHPIKRRLITHAAAQ
jgi:hypothetical protein